MAEPSLTDAERGELANLFSTAIALDEIIAPVRNQGQVDWKDVGKPRQELHEMLTKIEPFLDRIPPAALVELKALAKIIKGTATKCVTFPDVVAYLAQCDLSGPAWRGWRALTAAKPENANLYPWANDAETPTANFQQRARELLDWLESRLVASPQAGGRILHHSRLQQMAPLFSGFWWACKFRGLASELDAERQNELKHLWRLIGYDDSDGATTEFIARNHDQILMHQAPLRFATWEPTAVEALVGSLRLLAGGDKPAAPTNAGGQEFIARLLIGPDDMELTPRELALLEAHLAQPLSFSQMQREQQAGNPVAARQRDKLKLIRDFNRNLQAAAATPISEAIGAGDSGNGRDEKKAEVIDEPADTTKRFVFKPTGGGYWIEGFGESGFVGKLKGFQRIARLIEQAGKPVSMIELTSLVPATDEINAERRSRQPVYDRQAINELAKRRQELQADLDRAKADNHFAEASRIEQELNEIQQSALAATQLNGQSRNLNSDFDRMRPSIHKSLTTAYAKLRDAAPPMKAIADHFEGAISSEGGSFIYRTGGLQIEWLQACPTDK